VKNGSSTTGSGLRRLLAALGLLLAAALPASAVEPTREPLLRVETGMHTTLIRRIVADAPRNRLITCSDDKTIRIWQMPQQRLVATLRVPMDAGHEGQLFALAVSPDGRTVAAGGWTGWDWDGSASIYFLDAATGEISRRIGGFRDAIAALAWSPDGRHLAVGLQGRAGLDVLRLSDGQVAFRDSQYRDKLTDMDFDAGGRLVTTSLDGMVRLYDREFRILGRRLVPGGSKPITVRFSPDASQIAVGFADLPAMSVVSGRDLNFRFSPALAAATTLQQVLSVAWSADGQHLYAAGDHAGTGRKPIYRWAEGGRGPLETVPAANARITELQQLPGNRIAYAAEDPGFGVVGDDGRLESFRGPDVVDFGGSHGQLLLSADGAVIQYPEAPGQPPGRSFSALAAGDQATSATPAVPVFPPLLEAPGLKVEGWQNTFQPRINGKAPKLYDYEMARSYAITPDRKQILLGTEWALRLLDSQARERWNVRLAAVAWAVNVSRSGRFAVAALSDGTLRWYRMQDGKEVFAYFPHRNGRDWIAWLPDGHYVSSLYGDAYVGWHVNRGRDHAPDFFRAVQFDRVLYRPDLVQAGFRAAAGHAVRPESARYDISRIDEIRPPRLRLRVDGIEAQGSQASVRLQVQGERGAGATRDMAVFVNGIPVTPARERRLGDGEAEGFSRQFALPLFRRENEIRVEAFNGISLGVAETYVGLAADYPVAAAAGDLYLLAIGVNDFPALAKETALAFAARDAEDIARRLAENARGHFREVKVRIINDHTVEKPQKSTILDALEFIQQAGAADTVIVFLASHGVSDKAGNYYFVPRDASSADLARLARGMEPAGLISWTAFFDALRQTAGRRLLIVDTCHARGIEGRFESHSLMKRSAASRFSLMLASKTEEKSQEHEAAEHGLFTYSLLAALKPEADADRDGQISQRELFEAASRLVEQLRDRRIGPQTPQLIAPPSLLDQPVYRLVPVSAGATPQGR